MKKFFSSLFIGCGYILVVSTAASASLLNGSFESPYYNDSSFHIISENSIPGWETTATDGMMEIWSSGFSGVDAYDGDQFIELNANLVSSVYQDVDGFVAGDSVEWFFAHRGRRGDDTLGFSVIESVDGIFDNGNDYKHDFLSFTTGVSSWVEESDTFTALYTGSMRFIWESEKYTSQSVGNFLDGARLEITNDPVPEPATLLLFGAGLASLAGLRIRGRK